VEVVKFVADVFREFGAGNTALVIILGMFVYFFLKLMPPAVERVVAAVEKLGTTFAVHDERATLLYQLVTTVLTEIHSIKAGQVTETHLNRFHERIDNIVSNQVTKDQLDDCIELLKKELERHASLCEKQNNRIHDAISK